jgi:hypothetical protein
MGLSSIDAKPNTGCLAGAAMKHLIAIAMSEHLDVAD